MCHLVGDIRMDVIKMTEIEDGGDQTIVMRNGVVAVTMIGHLVIWIDHVSETMTGDVIRTDLLIEMRDHPVTRTDLDTEMMIGHPVTRTDLDTEMMTDLDTEMMIDHPVTWTDLGIEMMTDCPVTRTNLVTERMTKDGEMNKLKG